MVHFKKYESVEAFKEDNPTTKPVAISATDGGGKYVITRDKYGNEYEQTVGSAPFRVGASIIGGDAIL